MEISAPLSSIREQLQISSYLVIETPLSFKIHFPASKPKQNHISHSDFSDLMLVSQGCMLLYISWTL